MTKQWHKYTKTFFLSVVFFATDFVYSQSLFKKTLKAFNENNLTKVNNELLSIDTISISKYNKATWLYYYADYQFKKDNHDISYKNILKSKNIFLSLGKISDVVDCDVLILNILSHQSNLKINTNDILREVKNYALINRDTTILRKAFRRIAINFLNSNNRKKALEYFRKVLRIVKTQKDTIRIGFSYDNIGTTFQNTIPRNLDSAMYYSKMATPIYIKFKDFTSLAYNLNNRAQQLKIIGKFKESIEFLKKADSLKLVKNIPKSKLLFYKNIADTYNKLKDYKNEVEYLKKIAKLKDSINDTKQNIAISDLDKKYKTAEKEKQILQLESKRKQDVLLLTVVSLLLILGSVIYILSYQNTKRKQKLAEQQKELETQKNLTLLKEQEITTINAMVDGQEKERKRIAEDLHDNLGSVLATLKLHFENLKINREKKKINQEQLFNKTENLIDEAYLKVRRIAHAKNAGVIANQGLLLAVHMMAEKISSADKINIEVIHYGLDKRLENTLELTIFRIIQELVTNIIKHANAKNATINLSLYEKNLNIIVEDDGKGFDVKTVDLNNGMGISSIKTRVEYLEGTFSIDATIGKGSSIIVDVPIS